MERANETLAGIMTTEGMIRDREQFVRNLGDLLSQTRDGVLGCDLINAKQPGEFVLVTYKGGGTRMINTYMDSYAAIIRDVASRFQ